jgi:hypothetical protein
MLSIITISGQGKDFFEIDKNLLHAWPIAQLATRRRSLSFGWVKKAAVDRARGGFTARGLTQVIG